MENKEIQKAIENGFWFTKERFAMGQADGYFVGRGTGSATVKLAGPFRTKAEARKAMLTQAFLATEVRA